MELQDWINSTPEYLTQLKENDMIVRKKGDLCIVKYKYGRKTLEENWMRYCRGCVIDLRTNRLVCIPPPKAIPYTQQTFDDSYTVENLVDGTMINMFYVDDEWIMSTRSEIGCKNKWKSNRSFKDMFYECCPDFDQENLNPQYCYSFVMCHYQNRNISTVYQNCLCLVEAYDRDTLMRVDIQSMDLPNVLRITEFQYEKDIPLSYHIDSINEQWLDYNWKGLTIKCGNQRYNYINPSFQNVKDTSVNTNNKLFEYLTLVKEKTSSKTFTRVSGR